MKRTILILFTSVLLISCKDRRQVDPNIFYINNIDSTKVDHLITQKIQQLNLETLDKGFDSIQIRVWYDPSLLKKRDLLVLKYANGDWVGLHYYMTVDWDPFNSTETITDKTFQNVKPKNGWTNFLTKLSLLKIHSLPNMADIPGLEDSWDDGNIYTVEIAIGKKYRTYSYHVPQEFKEKYWQAGNMLEILDLISVELDIPK